MRNPLSRRPLCTRFRGSVEPRPPRAWTLVAALCLALAAPVARAAAGPAIAEVKVEGPNTFNFGVD